MPEVLSLPRPGPRPPRLLPPSAAVTAPRAPLPGVRPRTHPGPRPRFRPARGSLRLTAAVSAELARDGTGGEFRLARTRALRWSASRFGPLPAGFASSIPTAGAEGGCRVERHERNGTLVRAMDQQTASGRYFGLSVTLGGPVLPTLRILLVLAASNSVCRLRASLQSPRQRSQRKVAPIQVPAIVRGLADSPGLVDYGWRIHPTPWIVRDEEDVAGLIELIAEPNRTRPVFAIGLAPGRLSPETAPLDPFDLAHRTAGLAHVVVLTGPMTYVLTDRMGHRFSVFGNAVRTYRPGCRLDNEDCQHPMALSETVRRWEAPAGSDGGGPPEFAAFLAREAARTSVAFQAPRPLAVRGQSNVSTRSGEPPG